MPHLSHDNLMAHCRKFFVTAFLLTLLCVAFPAQITYAEQPEVTQIKYTMLNQINQVRASYGLYPYQLDERLSEAAQDHVADRYNLNYHSHWGSDGSNYYQRIRRAGYFPFQANETIGWGMNVNQQMNWWLNSRIHRSILLSTRYQHIGIGYMGNPAYRGGHWWAIKYAQPY